MPKVTKKQLVQHTGRGIITFAVHPKHVFIVFDDFTKGRVKLSDLESDPPDPTDDLTQIVGIGDTTAGRLYDAGYYTFELLANADPAAVTKAARANPNTVKAWQEDARTLSNAKEDGEEL